MGHIWQRAMPRLVAAALVVLAASLALSGPALADGGPTYDQPGAQDGPRGRSDNGAYWLVEKDADQDWRIVTRDEGTPFGRVKYNVRGATLRIDLRAHRLEPNRKYQIELILLGVPGSSGSGGPDTYYAIASVASDRGGNIRCQAELQEFAEVVGVGASFDAPTAIEAGQAYAVKLFVKNDGNPVSGADVNGLPNSGNGDGDYTYRLFEFLPVTFTAT